MAATGRHCRPRRRGQGISKVHEEFINGGMHPDPRRHASWSATECRPTDLTRAAHGASTWSDRLRIIFASALKDVDSAGVGINHTNGSVIQHSLSQILFRYPFL